MIDPPIIVTTAHVACTHQLTMMSTPLSTMRNELRRRFGPNTNTKDFPDGGHRILDEQGTANLWRTLEIPSSYLILLL